MQTGTQLTGKTALVTGATSGIGFYTAAALVRLGAAVYITGRDASRGLAAEQHLCALAGHDNVQFIEAEAATVGGNQLLAERVAVDTDHLHILVNNVGGAYNDRWETADGYEATLAMNFIGPYTLTQGLFPLLERSAPARIVNVASMSHALWRGDPFVDIQSVRSYVCSRAYSRAKLLNVMWTRDLARRLEGSRIAATSADPGGAWTSLTAGLCARSVAVWLRPIWPLMRLLLRRASAEDAARSSIFLASVAQAAHLNGMYVDSQARPARPSEAALDRRNQRQAWDLAVRLVATAPTAVGSDCSGNDRDDVHSATFGPRSH
jgi:retinol dehydrogenase 12